MHIIYNVFMYVYTCVSTKYVRIIAIYSYIICKM